MSSPRSAVSIESRLATVGLLALGALLVAPGLAAANGNSWSLEILSSAPDQVSGGDALVRVGFPGAEIKENAGLLLNGENVTDSLSLDDGSLVGVVGGFVLGDNLLQLKSSANASAVKAALAARNHPLSGPIFSGPQQQPFVCTTARTGLGPLQSPSPGPERCRCGSLVPGRAKRAARCPRGQCPRGPPQFARQPNS